MVVTIKNISIVDNEWGSLGGGYFRMSSVKWPDWYVYATWSNNVQCMDGYPGDDGRFKFDLMGEYYLISPRKWPEYYLYITGLRGDVRIYEGDPGSQGHWLITPCDDGTIVLTTEKWPQYYMYVQDSPSGDVQGISTKPEDLDNRAYFILSCDARVAIASGDDSRHRGKFVPSDVCDKSINAVVQYPGWSGGHRHVFKHSDKH